MEWRSGGLGLQSGCVEFVDGAVRRGPYWSIQAAPEPLPQLELDGSTVRIGWHDGETGELELGSD
ncbi:hypothetical protein EV643_103136 [Kribbella sp. VKM Ac-2527]|uniref:Uncharacterized protein n=1 Tax=Kribbella caucasensis TaxID=2512215 RepID=A0A4R6KP92_9ACTN|nr:hypothetical protein EV643_103136 [Kribbella sp. VKM Ac-2527]